MSAKPVRGILLDIEGTTSAISFVFDVMFPYVRRHLPDFLEDHFSDPAMQDSLHRLAVDLGHPDAQDWLGDRTRPEKLALVIAAVNQLMDDDVKATGLKQIQGQVWKNGFESGQLVAHVFDDVAPAIRNWTAAGIDVRIYSSGSIAAQKLFFGHTVEGDLLSLFGGHYDTTTGPKQESASYQTIAKQFECPADEILFISDVVEELAAAKSVGMQTLLSIRDGNKPVASAHGFEQIHRFDEVRC